MDKETFEFLRDLAAGYGVISFICYPCWWIGQQVKAFVERLLAKDAELVDENERWLIQ
jgi:hypothetical protein